RKARASLAHAVRLALRLDPLLLQPGESSVEIVDADCDVPIGVAHFVRAPVVVVGEFQNVLLVANREEVVRRLEVAVPDDVHVTTARAAEPLIEGPSLLRVSDAQQGMTI